MSRRSAKSEITTATKFPLLTECLRHGGSVALFPVLKDWDRPKLNALLAEINAADDAANEAYRELLFEPEFFLHKSGQRALDEARMEATVILSEIAAVALHFIGQKEAKETNERC